MKLRSLCVPIGLALGMAFGASTFESVAEAEPADCTKSCECQGKCEDDLATCNAGCEKKSGADKTSCLIKCNDALMKCMKGCPNPACGCGGY